MSYTHLDDNEVSPLTIEEPDIVQDLPSGPDITPAASSEPMEQPSDDQVGPPTPGKPKKELSTFDFNGPYMGSPQSHSLPDLPGQLVPPQMSESLKPALPGSLEYLCLPPGGQVQLVPLSQAMGQGQAVDAECASTLENTGNASMEQRNIPAFELKVEEEKPEESPMTLPISPGCPEDTVLISDYVTPTDLVLTLPTGTLSTSLGPTLGFPSNQRPRLCPELPGVPPECPALGPPEFEDYVELPPSMIQLPKSSLGNPVPPMPNSPTVSSGDHREEVTPVSPQPEGLLFLQQVGDYCFLPGLGPGPLSPCSKPSSPSLCPEIGDLHQDLPAHKLPGQPMPQVPAIQFFKSLKHQDYLSLPPWDSSQPGKVC